MRLRMMPLALLAVGTVQAQGGRLESIDGEPRIVVSSTKSAKVAADRATVYLLVEGVGESPSDAAQRAGLKVQSVTNAIRQAGMAEAPTVVPYGVTPAPNLNNYPGGAGQSAYVARFAVRVQVTKLDQITPLAAAAIAAGASSSATPQFEASTADAERRARFSDALAAARQDAEVLAGVLGGRLGALIEVSSSGSSNQQFSTPYISFQARYDMGGQSQVPEVQVMASVTVRYRFIPK